MRSLSEFAADLLEHKGAIVETSVDGVEAVLPQEIAGQLELPEHVKLVCGPDCVDGIRLSYEGDVFRNLSRLLGDKCRFAVAAFSPREVRAEKMEKLLSERMAFNNAAFRLGQREEKPISYLLACFKYTAISDEKQEGIVTFLVNELNLSVRRVADMDVLPALGENRAEGGERALPEGVLRALSMAPEDMVREDVADFVRSLERRLNRDIRRIRDYYHSLIQEARLAQMKAKGENERDGTAGKIRAIEAELEWKVQDTISKYRLAISIEPVSFVRVETRTVVFEVEVKRRKGERVIPVTFNPMLKVLDLPSCESCFGSRRVYTVCDDHLHIVCEKCFAVCGKCGKAYCRACHERACPRCGWGEK